MTDNARFLTALSLTCLRRIFLVLTFATAFPLLDLASQELPVTKVDPEKSVALIGVVRDDNGQVISGSEVIVNHSQHAVSDSAGHFTIADIPPGMIVLTARRVGYQPVEVSLKADPGARVSLAVKLVPNATQLGTIVIEGKKFDRHLWEIGFYKRADANFGTFFSPDYLAHRPRRLGSLLNDASGLRLVHGRGGSTLVYGRAGAGMMGPTYCALHVFLDGKSVPWASESGIDAVVNRDDILAIEVYPRASEIPASISGLSGSTALIGGITKSELAFGGGTAECGAMLIWTKST